MTTYQETNAVTDSTQEVMKVQYTAKTHTSGGRRGGVSRSDDGRLDVKFSKRLVNVASLPPDIEIESGWDACLASMVRPAAPERIKELIGRGFSKPGDAENGLGDFAGRLRR
jgi:hypothetical protein